MWKFLNKEDARTKGHVYHNIAKYCTEDALKEKKLIHVFIHREMKERFMYTMCDVAGRKNIVNLMRKIKTPNISKLLI